MPTAGASLTRGGATRVLCGTMFGFGEDALTLLLLGRHARGLVRALERTSPALDPKVFYRPSFGRRATKRRGGVAVGPPRAEFGEFDAIVATPAGTYLVEVKWSRSRGADAGGVFELDDAQVRRHCVMRHYFEAWRGVPVALPDDRRSAACWGDFLAGADLRARLAAHDVAVPGPRTVLAGTLRHVLLLLDGCGPVRDVLLWAEGGDERGRALSTCPWRVRPGDFTTVRADVRALQVGPFVLLPALADAPDLVDFTLR